MHSSLGASVEGLHLCNPLSPPVAEPHGLSSNSILDRIFIGFPGLDTKCVPWLDDMVPRCGCRTVAVQAAELLECHTCGVWELELAEPFTIYDLSRSKHR